MMRVSLPGGSAAACMHRCSIHTSSHTVRRLAANNSACHIALLSLHGGAALLRLILIMWGAHAQPQIKLCKSHYSKP